MPGRDSWQGGLRHRNGLHRKCDGGQASPRITQGIRAWLWLVGNLEQIIHELIGQRYVVACPLSFRVSMEAVKLPKTTMWVSAHSKRLDVSTNC